MYIYCLKRTRLLLVNIERERERERALSIPNLHLQFYSNHNKQSNHQSPTFLSFQAKIRNTTELTPSNNSSPNRALKLWHWSSCAPENKKPIPMAIQPKVIRRKLLHKKLLEMVYRWEENQSFFMTILVCFRSPSCRRLASVAASFELSAQEIISLVSCQRKYNTQQRMKKPVKITVLKKNWKIQRYPQETPK